MANHEEPFIHVRVLLRLLGVSEIFDTSQHHKFYSF